MERSSLYYLNRLLVHSLRTSTMTPHMEQWLEAAGDGDLELLKDLLHGNPYTDINAGDRCGSSALHYAAEKGRLDVAKFLVGQGAIVNVTNMWDKTPLHEAANEGHDQMVWFLVENGARIEATSNKKRFTPLHLASQFGHTSVVEYLVQNGADVSAQTEVRSAKCWERNTSRKTAFFCFC